MHRIEVWAKMLIRIDKGDEYIVNKKVFVMKNKIIMVFIQDLV